MWLRCGIKCNVEYVPYGLHVMSGSVTDGVVKYRATWNDGVVQVEYGGVL